MEINEMAINLDPELQAVTDAAKALGRPHGADVPLAALRAGYVAGSQMQGVTDVTCDKIQDLEIPGPASAIPARLYVPAGTGDAKTPGMIFIHGGGFMIGNLDSHDSVCRQLANHGGSRVIAIDYRLAPEHKFPAAVDDAIAAAKWICENAENYNINPTNMKESRQIINKHEKENGGRTR